MTKALSDTSSTRSSQEYGQYFGVLLHWVLSLEYDPAAKRPTRDNATARYVEEKLSESEKDEWLLKLEGVSITSDGYFPFSDSIEAARSNGVKYVAQPGGSMRDDEVIAACDKYGMTMAFTGVRLFHH